MAGMTRQDIDFLGLYDDYVIIVLMQIEDLGFCQKGDLKYFESTDFSFRGKLPIQTGGGMINCGQPSTAGGTLHITEAVRQLRGEAGERQVKDAHVGLVTGPSSKLSKLCGQIQLRPLKWESADFRRMPQN